MKSSIFDLLKVCLPALITAIVGGLFAMNKTKFIDKDERWRRDVNNNILPICARIVKEWFYDAMKDPIWESLPFKYEYKSNFQSNLCEIVIDIFNIEKLADIDNVYTIVANDCFNYIYNGIYEDLKNINSKYDISVNIVGDCKIGINIQNK